MSSTFDSAIPVFNLCGPLPSGTTLLEASAGTGKTFTIAGLATRYIAEAGVPVEQLLLVTFGRAATRELRERVREALVLARRALAQPGSDVGDNEVIGHLRSADPQAQARYLQRLTLAVANFDSATILTTHQFAQQALTTLGLLADGDAGQSFAEDTSELVGQVVTDLYLRRYFPDPLPPGITPNEALSIGLAAVGDPHARLEAAATDPPECTARVRLAQAVRTEVARRLRVARLVTFDELISRLADALTDERTGPGAVSRLQSRYRVVMVDEFQDTDPKQWQILRTTFHGAATLILIGDPKQAIYGFRGADVYSYLAARAEADTHATLGTNFRSDAQVVAGVTDLMGGLELGDHRIVVGPVAASPQHATSRLRNAGTAGVRLRLVGQDGSFTPGVGEIRRIVAADVAADIAALLCDVRLVTKVPSATHAGCERALLPGDIAVLVARNKDAVLIRDALLAAGIPGVVNGTTSVFATSAAQQWLELLRALDNPRPAAFRGVALTDFFGRTATELGTQGDAVAEDVAVHLRRWTRTLQSGSMAAMQAQIEAETGLGARVLSRPDGERDLTDLRHIAAILHAQWRLTRAGAAGLSEWLADRIRATGDVARESGTETTQRLESDAQAVQILTIHRSKGLQFPVVYVPYAWNRYPGKGTPAILRCHDQQGERVLDVRGHGAERAANLKAADAEEAGEQLRLLYVALTRAASLIVVHWAGSKTNTTSSPLHRVLAARREGTTTPKPSYRATAAPIAAVRHASAVALEQVSQAPPPKPQPTVTAATELVAARIDRTLDTTWRRTSFTALSSHDAPAPERAPETLRTDEPAEDDLFGLAAEAVQPQSGPSPVMPFAGLPGGAAFGTMVHEILQDLPTAAPELDTALEQACVAALALTPMADTTPQTLSAALRPALATPLGSLAANRSLSAIPAHDRLAELEFELPLAATRRAGTLTAVAGLLREHLTSDDPLRAYPAALVELPGADRALCGYLAGAIDAVLRVPDEAGSHRYLVVDYKTNWLRRPGAPHGALEQQPYHPDALPAAMISSHYPLQALLYCVALHRYLRWRLPGYDPDCHLGGVLYLYLRGMTGACTESGEAFGVFTWRPPAALVVAMSDLLDGVDPAPPTTALDTALPGSATTPGGASAPARTRGNHR